MAATYSKKRSNVQGLPGVNRIEIEYTESAPTAGAAATSAALALGQSFSDIRLVAIAGKGASGLVQASYVVDTSSTVKIRYVNSVAESTTIIATFECKG